MKNLPYRYPILAVLLIGSGLLGWWFFGSDPQAVFLGKIDKMIEQANQGEHMALRKKLSPEIESYITDNFTSVEQALLIARKFDTEGQFRYRFVQIDIFQKGDYAEIEVERSGPNGNFSEARRFPLPFVYRDREWLLAGAFRDKRDFINPFE